jgi:molybdenum cofactor cytidylyltransferase
MSTKPLKLAIVVLAAGESKRMGQPKQNLTWGNTTLLGHTIEQVLRIQLDDVFVVLGAHYEKIYNRHKSHPVQFIENKNWKNDLGSSISFATQQLKAKNYAGILFVLADQPQVTASYLKGLIKSFMKDKNQIIATQYEHINGIPVLFDACYFDELIANSKEGAKSVIKSHLSNTVSIKPEQYLRDIDTLADYENETAVNKTLY